MVAENPIELELMLNRFRRLITDITRGTTSRNAFEPWEVEILLDLANCEIAPRHRMETLRQYEKAVTRQMESGTGPPMKLSQYLQEKMTRRPSTR